MFRHPVSWIVLALVITVLIFWDGPGELLVPTPELAPAFPQAYMEQMETRVFDTDGRLRYHLQADSAEHYQPDPRRATELDYSLIDQPDLTMYPQDANPWHLVARTGRTDARGDQVHLSGGVRAWQDDERGLTEIITSELWVDVPREYAHTDKAVKMRAVQGTTDAVGMQAELGEERIELLSEVRSVYNTTDASGSD